ncbi:hypothetical protein [Paraeggerthella hominis]|uniref:hypothetical protein n=1 Tax=Paraeggerthella hominis TaxID=2897351 RepID=UPI001E375484|nr:MULTISPECIES: hypothetical protein [Paraeggerthella]MCD2433417.1 hypothetical protein [Paraeggerthella hominis]
MMVVQIPRHRRAREENRRSWHGGAFIVESLVLLAFLMAALAVVVQLTGIAHERGTEADHLSNAVTIAANNAEAFAADPASGNMTASFTIANGSLVEVDGTPDAGDESTTYQVNRTVEQHDKGGGTLYTAHIAVTQGAETVYTLDTSRYSTGAEEA